MNGINKTHPLLSICIPTWNRAKYLDISLNSFIDNLKDVQTGEVELLISDNASTDDTPIVVQKYIDLGLPISYNRNEENIGAAGNFIKCMQWASGKYIQLLGDDDLLKCGAINLILKELRRDDYGLVYIHKFSRLGDKNIIYENRSDFLKTISYWITFMSGSIFRSDIVDIVDAEKYRNTHLLQVPFYLKSAFSQPRNLIISQDILQDGLDSSSAGGYNFYEVFIKNYLSILNEFVQTNDIDYKTYEWLKKDIFCNFIVRFNYRFFLKKINIKQDNMQYTTNRKGFIIKDAKTILNEYYSGFYYKLYSLITYIKMWIKNE